MDGESAREQDNAPPLTGTGATRPSGGIACDGPTARGVATRTPPSLRTTSRIPSRAGLARVALPHGPPGANHWGDPYGRSPLVRPIGHHR